MLLLIKIALQKYQRKWNFIEIYTTVPLVTHFFPFFVSSVDVLKLFYFVTYYEGKQADVFVPGKAFPA
jgi:hypothetical protein